MENSQTEVQQQSPNKTLAAAKSNIKKGNWIMTIAVLLIIGAIGSKQSDKTNIFQPSDATYWAEEDKRIKDGDLLPGIMGLAIFEGYGFYLINKGKKMKAEGLVAN